MEREISRSPSEADDLEIDERIYECYLGLLPLSGPAPGSSNADSRQQICDRGLPVNQRPPRESYLTHYWQSADRDPCPNDTQQLDDVSRYQTFTLLESQNLIEGGTTGLRTWPASFRLARYLSQHTEIVAHKRVLELGSGVGFLGALIATLQIQQLAASSRDLYPGSLYLTDINDEVLTRCQNNIRLDCNLSSTHPDIHVRTLDWCISLDCEQRNVLVSFIENEVKPDIVVGADLVFDPFLIPALVGVLSLVLSGSARSAERHAFIALTNRNPTTMNSFVDSVKDAGLGIVEFSSSILDPYDEFAGEENVYLFRVTA
ncbi:hypothetical protein AGABI1DRAFT_67067 [Agaricus bisporus var. burnettii JB137-S8]|uniref:FAM86 N-terminal domain-containing protein n=1 Tax=Agaricus bisporus var. burnettii (strain JB137-S8 / ATCC MYA-4627 / FGSC 10392) TaxID=597362 RepID=K5XKP2_AGABU|nr:uncharacterized protein AGABI1DRAFT_67067 [Agaricus bisporus var. burnettii JB137-S8]EKM83962.1 hypothetical protein AGABI1DRAFT_67067 [Agaricus bisporus var. burnettii JB137-S8]